MSKKLPILLFIVCLSHGAIFLKITPGTRAIGLGGAFTAIADDPSACYYNPAGLAFIHQPQVLSMNLSPPPGIAKGMQWMFAELPYQLLGQHERSELDPYYLSDFRLIYWALVVPFDAKQSLGIGMHYLNLGEFNVRNLQGIYLGNYYPYEYALSISYGRKVIDYISIGISAKYIYEFHYPQWVRDTYNLTAPGSVSSFAVDHGILFKAPFGLSIGASLLHLGPDIDYEYTKVQSPLTGRIGIAQSITDFFSVISKENSVLNKVNRWLDVRLSLERRFDIVEEDPYHQTTWGLEVKTFDVLSYRQGWTLAGRGLFIMDDPKSFGLDLGIVQLDITVTDSDYPEGIWWIQSTFKPLGTKPEFIQNNETLDRIFLNLSCLTIPGGGQLYNGDIWKGIPLVITSFLIADAILERDARPDWQHKLATISLPILYVGSTIEANSSRRR